MRKRFALPSVGSQGYTSMVQSLRRQTFRSNKHTVALLPLLLLLLLLLGSRALVLGLGLLFSFPNSVRSR
jgi:hypothetical protein